MKKFCSLPRSHKPEPPHQMLSYVMTRRLILESCYPSANDAVAVFPIPTTLEGRVLFVFSNVSLSCFWESIKVYYCLVVYIFVPVVSNCKNAWALLYKDIGYHIIYHNKYFCIVWLFICLVLLTQLAKMLQLFYIENICYHIIGYNKYFCIVWLVIFSVLLTQLAKMLQLFYIENIGYHIIGYNKYFCIVRLFIFSVLLTQLTKMLQLFYIENRGYHIICHNKYFCIVWLFISSVLLTQLAKMLQLFYIENIGYHIICHNEYFFYPYELH